MMSERNHVLKLPILLQEAAISLRETLASVIQKVEEHWNCDIEMEESERNHVLNLSILLQEAAISLQETVASVIQKVEEHWNYDE